MFAFFLATFVVVLALNHNPAHALIESNTIHLAAVPDSTEATEEKPPEGAAEVSLFQEIEPHDDDFLILELWLGRYQLHDGLIAYMMGEEVCVLLSDWFVALEFPIVVEPEAGLAEGWFYQESRTFSLDLESGQVVVAGESEDLDPDRLHLYPDGICVALSLLQEWFPVEGQLDLENSLIDLITWEPLPLEQRLAREKRRLGLAGRYEDLPDYPAISHDYRFLTGQLLRSSPRSHSTSQPISRSWTLGLATTF